MEQYGIGQSVHRVEDQRLLTGGANYLDDIDLPQLCHAALLRSPHSHARIVSIDCAMARTLPGVLAVLTGSEWAQSGWGNIPTRTAVKHADGSAIEPPPRPGLVQDWVRFVGDAVALVVAETAALARAALESIEVEYEALAAVVDPVQALEPGAPLVWDQIGGNLCVKFSSGDREATEQALASADHVVALDLINQRVTAVPMEPRGAIGQYHADSDSYTLIASSQNVHANRQQIAEQVIGIPADRVHFWAPEVGGGFGVKNSLYPEYALVLFAAREVQRPVKWLNDRSESFLSDVHGREQHSRVELALSKAGEFLGLRVCSVGNVGAYMSTIGPFVATGGSARTQGGPYRLATLYFESKVAYTHTVPTDPYRGAGRPEASYVIERIIDVAAVELGFDPIELRRRNALRSDELPYKTASGAEIDSGDFPAVLERTLELGKYNGFVERRHRSQQAGLLRGIGVALYYECTGGGPREFAALRFAADGSVELAVGSHSTGMGHETAMAQIVSDRLGVPFHSIRFCQGDTAATPIGGGHGGSRSLEVGGAAVLMAADQVIEKARELAAHQLEAALSDLEFAHGRFTIAGTDRTIALPELIRLSFDRDQLPQGMEPGLDQDAIFDRARISFPNGCHLAEVEVDPETGHIAIIGYSIVDDFGTIINPLLADGQVMGGTAQGIGQALLEQVIYDPADGQLLSGTLLDYGLPRADDLPNFDIAYFEDAPTLANPLGVKGSGEAGCVGAPPAVVNAVMNALKDYDVQHLDMPLTPEKVWRALQFG